MHTQNTFILKGHILYAQSQTQIFNLENGYLICKNGVVDQVLSELPDQYQHLPLTDYGDRLIIPGLVDLHIHAPQYPFAGLGMDMELIPWLNTYAFVEEAKYQDEAYATKAYTNFVNDLTKSATTRAVIFGTLHVPATQILMSLLNASGIDAFVGKVNMDRNSPESLREETNASVEATKQWLLDLDSQKTSIKPILTPRFVPSCSNTLLEELGTLAKLHQLPIQSHLSENIAEISWVKELHPDCDCYAGAYEKYGLLGSETPSIMAHCVHPCDQELALLKSNGTYIAHCPGSNTNLSSGIAPIRKMLDNGLSIGLGTDVAAGFSLSIFRAMSDAIQVSKLYHTLLDPEATPLTIPEVFYLATKGGGSFWGKVGSFEPGYAFDAVILDDSSLKSTCDFSLIQRLERLIYLSDDRNIVAKYVNGNLIL